MDASIQKIDTPKDPVQAAAQQMFNHAIEVIVENRAVAGLSLPGLSVEQLIQARDIASEKIQAATGLSRMPAEQYEEFFQKPLGSGQGVANLSEKTFPAQTFAMPIHINHAPTIFTPIPSANEPQAPAPEIQVLVEKDWNALREALDTGRQGHESSKQATMAAGAGRRRAP
jgi:hypothetical protein